jgi:hypothetical protein
MLLVEIIALWPSYLRTLISSSLGLSKFLPLVMKTLWPVLDLVRKCVNL